MGLGVKIFCSSIKADSHKTIAIINIIGDISMIRDITTYIEDYFIIHKYTHYDIIKALDMLKTYCDENIKEVEMEIKGEL